MSALPMSIAPQPKAGAYAKDRYASSILRRVPLVRLTPEQDKAAWEEFTRSRCPILRSRLICRYSPLVTLTVIASCSKLPPNVMWDDLIGPGFCGLIRAVDHYDPGRGVQFNTYAIAWIRGRVKEELRETDWQPRSVRDHAKRREAAHDAVLARTGRPPRPDEIADELRMEPEQYDRVSELIDRKHVSIDEIAYHTDDASDLAVGQMIADPAPGPHDLTERAEEHAAVRAAVEALPPRERRVFYLYYTEELSFLKIGRMMGISESRAYQLRTQGLARLRTWFGVEEGEQA